MLKHNLVLFMHHIVEQAECIEVQCDENFNSKEITSKYYSEITIIKKDEDNKAKD